MTTRQRCVDVVVVLENAYYFSLFSNLKISLFLVGQGWQPWFTVCHTVLVSVNILWGLQFSFNFQSRQHKPGSGR